MFDKGERDIMRQRIVEWREAADMVTTMLAAACELEKALDRFEHDERELLESPGAMLIARHLANLTPQGRPNVGVYEDILRDNGAPMHARDIAAEAKRRGVIFQGKHAVDTQVRNSMTGSKRFKNVGSNTWWIDESLPDIFPLVKRLTPFPL